MARYQLRVHSADGTIDYAVPINNTTGKIDATYHKKNELFTIDNYIMGSFDNKEALLEHLKEYNFYVTDDMTPYISYRSEKKKQVLEVVYNPDMELRDFSTCFEQLSKLNIGYEQRQKTIYKDETWQNFIQDVYVKIFDDDFYDFLKDNLYYIKPYAFNCISSIRDNAKWERQDESEAYHIALNGFHEIYTSYKQIRGMKLAIRAYESKLLREQEVGEKVSTDSYFTNGYYYTGDEVLDSYIREQSESKYNEELLKLYSLDDLASLPDEVKEQIHIDGMSR